MASIPTATNCRDYLEGYNITTAIVSDSWIEDERDNDVVPWWEGVTRMSLSAETEVTEYYSGNGDELLILNRRPVNSVSNIEYVLGTEVTGVIGGGSFEVITTEGILKAKYGFADGAYLAKLWPKGKANIKVTYKYGGSIANDVAHAIKMITCIVMLDLIEGRTGGGAIGVQAFNRNYGKMGKYNNIRMKLSQRAMAILKRYSTGIVGA